MNHEINMGQNEQTEDIEKELEQAKQKFKKQFMIQGEETQDLKEALRRAPEELITLIWKKTVESRQKEESDDGGTRGAAEKSRMEKEEILYQEIQESLRSELTYLKMDDIELLLEVRSGRPIELIDAVRITRDFTPTGWVFNFVEDELCSYVISKEIEQILSQVEEPQVKEKVVFNAYVRGLVKACLGLYGVFRQEELEKMYDHVTEPEEKTEQFAQKLEELLPRLEEQNMFWTDGGYIVDPYLETRGEYQQLLAAQGQCSYYMPKDDTLVAYVFQNGLEKTPEYEAVHRCLVRELKDTDMAEAILEELSDYVTKEDWGIPQIMNSLYQWDVAFDNARSAGKMTKALSEWVYGVRRWSERGYSRKERGKVNEENRYVYAEKTNFSRTEPAKVYPNDPCPCGSGRKYKKCCGR